MAGMRSGAYRSFRKLEDVSFREPTSPVERCRSGAVGNVWIGASFQKQLGFLAGKIQKGKTIKC